MTKGHKKGDKIEAVEIVAGRSVVPFELQVSMATDLACDQSLNTHTRIEFSPSALLCMLHPCPTQSSHMGILASSHSLLSSQISPALPDPRQRGQIRLSRLNQIQSRSESPESAGSTRTSRDPSPPCQSESASLI
jgi:hypothetical protein